MTSTGHTMPRQAWRDQVIEPALDPDIEIIDAHHHLWAVPRRAKLEAYEPEALFADMCGSGHDIAATVYVDAFANYRVDGPEHLRVVGETEYADSVGREADRRGGCAAGACAAIVGNADLSLGRAVGEILDHHVDASPRLRAIRRMTVSDPDLATGIAPGILLMDAFREGFEELASRGLVFEACVCQSQLAEVTALARAFPDTTIVLNHLGTPLAVGRYAGHAEAAAAEWQRGMADLAGCPNVVVKLGGMNMAFTGLGVADDAARPLGSEAMADRQRFHVLTTIDLFGADRCLFESNFPVDKWYTSYTVLWNAFKRIAADLPPGDRAALFAGTARRIYGLAPR